MTKPASYVSHIITGVSLGLSAVVMWGAYLAFARAGTKAGLQPQDFILLRFGVAGVVMLPWLVGNGFGGLAGVGWGRGMVLALFAGPAFVGFGTAGYIFAPLAHGAVLLPTSVTLGVMGAAFLAFGERPTRRRVLGIAVSIAGLIMIASRKSDIAGLDAWKGDLLFIAAGLFWAAFTILLRYWKVAAIPATAAVSVVSAIAVIPWFLTFEDLDRLLNLTFAMLFAQVLVMGLLSGVLAVIAYGKTVEILGASRAALFPALVPVGALIVGLPVTGEMPAPTEWIGAGLATLGLAIALGLVMSNADRS